MSALMMDALVAAAAAVAEEEEAEWRRRVPVSWSTEEQQARVELHQDMDGGEGIWEHVSSSTSILLKLAVFGVAVSVLMYGVFRGFVVIYDAFVPGRVAGAAVLLLAAALVWREQQERQAGGERTI